MINGFEYRDHTPKCPERSDKWLNEPDDETQDDEQDEQKDERTSDESVGRS